MKDNDRILAYILVAIVLIIFLIAQIPKEHKTKVRIKSKSLDNFVTDFLDKKTSDEIIEESDEELMQELLQDYITTQQGITIQ